MKASLWIGTYTSGGNAQGMYEAELDMESGALSGVRLVIRQEEPSYLTFSGDGRRLYAVEEAVPNGRVFSYMASPEGWVQTGCEASGGSAPCHVMLDEEHNTLAVANYMDGAVSFYALDASGALHGGRQTIVMEGKGVHPERQECAHAHQCVRYEEKLLVCDLGADKVRVFHRDGDGRYGEEAPLMHTRAGAGPRHLVVTRDGAMLYLLCELQNVLYAFRKTDKGFVEEGVYGYLPDQASQSAAAAVRLSADERFLFVSSRDGFNGVALFELHPKTRLPQLRDVCPTGATPRDILPAGAFLLCACQDQNVVQVLKLDPEQKKLAMHGEISVPRPVCLVLKR